MIVGRLPRISHLLAPLLAIYPLAAQPYEFGHRTHLTMRLECVRCHPDTAQRDAPPAKGESTYSPDACLDCHGRAILDLRIVLQPPIAHFSHAVHMKLKNERCESCHHGLLESEKVTDAVNPLMGECGACHKEIAQPERCVLCHATDDPRLQSQRPVPGTSQSR
ncbi:MAG TPA: cytochrome c3 family protein [Bryobacteraceae bacterium]|nr:cytochrome c3 family protein [Bryobacteraceae bacterium]